MKKARLSPEDMNSIHLKAQAGQLKLTFQHLKNFFNNNVTVASENLFKLLFSLLEVLQN